MGIITSEVSVYRLRCSGRFVSIDTDNLKVKISGHGTEIARNKY